MSTHRGHLHQNGILTRLSIKKAIMVSQLWTKIQNEWNPKVENDCRKFIDQSSQKNVAGD